MVENEIQQLFNNSYTPAFFRMKIDLPVDLTDLNTLTPEVIASGAKIRGTNEDYLTTDKSGIFGEVEYAILM